MKTTALKIIICLLLSSSLSYSQSVDNLKNTALPNDILQSVLYDRQGKTTTLETVLAELKGKVVYLDFWASWCGACIKEMPHSVELQTTFSGQEVVFLYISTDKKDADWQQGLADIKVVGEHYRIEKKSKTAVRNYFKIPGVPYYILLDKQGLIADPQAKWCHDARIVEDIKNLLK